LVLLWFAHALWYCAFLALPNLSLYTRHAMGREPAEFSGIITAIQFGTKSVAGYALGALYARCGVRAPLIASVAFLGLAMVWAWAVPGPLFLVAFGLIGAGQLGGIYFPNVLLSWSHSRTAPQDMAILGLATVAASPAPAVYGMLADHWGFSSSFILAIVFALAALALVLRLPLEVGSAKHQQLSEQVDAKAD
jgi:MFS family permease